MNHGAADGAARRTHSGTDVSVRGRCPATAAQLWSVLSDIRVWPQWLPTVTAATPDDPAAPDGAGAAYLVSQPRLGTARWVITDWRPGVGFTWESRRPGVVTIGTHELQAATDDPFEPTGTTVELGIGWHGPLAWFARLAYRRMTRDYLERELAALRLRVGDAGSDSVTT